MQSHLLVFLLAGLAASSEAVKYNCSMPPQMGLTACQWCVGMQGEGQPCAFCEASRTCVNTTYEACPTHGEPMAASCACVDIQKDMCSTCIYQQYPYNNCTYCSGGTCASSPGVCAALKDKPATSCCGGREDCDSCTTGQDPHDQCEWCPVSKTCADIKSLQPPHHLQGCRNGEPGARLLLECHCPSYEKCADCGKGDCLWCHGKKASGCHPYYDQNQTAVCDYFDGEPDTNCAEVCTAAASCAECLAPPLDEKCSWDGTNNKCVLIGDVAAGAKAVSSWAEACGCLEQKSCSACQSYTVDDTYYCTFCGGTCHQSGACESSAPLCAMYPYFFVAGGIIAFSCCATAIFCALRSRSKRRSYQRVN